MLNAQEFDNWCHRLKISGQARSVIEQIRSSEPVRRVRSNGINVVGSYSSMKMGRTIQFESHKVELPASEEYEQDNDVLEYYDQPYRLSLKVKAKNGRTVTVTHVPDFFVIRKSSAGFEEWKSSVRLEKLATKQPERYVFSIDVGWLSPPVAEVVEQLGLYYRLRTDKEINWVKYRNRQFLKAYTIKTYQINVEVANRIREQVALTPGITYSDLIKTLTATSDEVNALIANGEIYTDLSVASLAEPERVHLFVNQAAADAYNHWLLEQKITGENSLFAAISNQTSTTFTSSIHPEAIERYLKASPCDLAQANHRYQIITQQAAGQPTDNATISERTIRYWKAKYILAQKKYNWGYIGLLDNHASKGNRKPKISQQTQDFIDKIIVDHYETLKQKGKMAVYGVLKHEWEKNKNPEELPSYVTFCNRIKQRSGYEQTKKRLGSRAAYQQSAFYWELDLTTPPHGDRPWEIAHIDHTQVDVELVCSRTGRNLGRPWATLLMDAYSRRILAVYLTFDEPSYRSIMMVLRICVQRYSRLPETIVVDGGAEFSSIYFETLLAAFGCTKKQRPPAKARFGSVIERLFGTTNTEFFHNLQGNTQITKQVRLVTKSNNPKKQAVWTLDELYAFFCIYSYEFYDNKEHPTLGKSPYQAFTEGIEKSGKRKMQEIIYDENFKIFTLPSTPKGTAKVQPSRGIKINYLYYWSIDDSFIQPEIEGTDVPVRYDPFDMGTAYAYVKGQWIRCISQYYKSFQNRSEREVKIATVELRRTRQKSSKRINLTAKERAAYLEEAEAKEAILEQRLHDLAGQDVRSIIEGGITQPTGEDQKINQSQKVKKVAKSNLKSEKSLEPKIDFNTINPYANEELW